MTVRFFLLIAVLMPFYASCASDDSSKVSERKALEDFRSAGFNFSMVSGLGISYRYHWANTYLTKVTGGIIKSDSALAYSFGFEYQFNLSNRSDLRYYLTAGVAVYNSTEGSRDFNTGFGIGYERPVFGNDIKENMTIGIAVFYPAFFFSETGNTISYGISFDLYYNF